QTVGGGGAAGAGEPVAVSRPDAQHQVATCFGIRAEGVEGRIVRDVLGSGDEEGMLGHQFGGGPPDELTGVLHSYLRTRLAEPAV
ncbi:hypothetical protein SB782_36160, partial [Brevibacillus sp. SIMBA_076]